MTLAIEIQRDWLDYVEALGSIGGVIAAAVAVGVAAFVSWRIALADSKSNDGRFTIDLLYKFRFEFERFFASLESETAIMIDELFKDGELLVRLRAISRTRRSLKPSTNFSKRAR